MSEVFLFGATSMLGWSILRAGRASEITAFCNALTRSAPEGIAAGIDLDDETEVAALFAKAQPRMIINCAGVCDVGTCEDSPEFAHSVNVEGTRFLLAHAPPSARIVHLSPENT
jgi:dTDP-4-dehydrorhamnose reductase